MSGYFAVIPGFVLDNPDLDSNHKILYAEISALCNRAGYCWASNDFFAAKFGCSPRSIRNWLAKLKACGYIYMENANSFKRQIYLDQRAPKESNETYKAAMKADLNRQIDNEELSIPEVGSLATRHQDSANPETGCLVPGNELPHSITLSNKDKKEINTSAANAAVAKQVGKQVLKTMTEAFPITKDEWPLHAKKARQIADRVCEMAPESPSAAAGVVLAAFRDLIDNGDGFWRKQPYTAPTLASAGIWSRVVDHIRKTHEMYSGRASPEPNEWEQFMEDIW